jgi:hypothetical protein
MNSSNLPLGLAIAGCLLETVTAMTQVLETRVPSDEFAEFVASAKGRPYVLVSVIENINVLNEPPDDPVSRTVEVRATYVVLCLQHLSPGDGSFIDGFSGQDSPRVIPWRGTARESARVNTYLYDVELSCAPGEFVTVETGADIVYELPRHEDAHSIDLDVDKNDKAVDFWGYPTEDDYIFDLTMIAQSNTGMTGLPGGAKLRKKATAETRSEDPFQQAPDRGNGGRSALVGHWHQLGPKEEVALQWKFH